ncbi:MAG: DUF6488 family protein [Sulfurimonas sp.]
MNKKISSMIIVIAISLVTNSLYAQENKTHTQDELHIQTKHEHNHSCAAKIELSKKDIQRAARKRLWMLTQKKKISASWLEVPIVSTDKKQFADKVEWVVDYRNLNIKDEKKQNIYIFVDYYGHVMGANYTGE